MKWATKFSKEYIYIFSIVVAFIAITLLLIFNNFLSKSGNRLDYDLNGILTYLVPLIFVLSICLLSGNIGKLKFRMHGIRTGLLLGWLFLAVGLFNFIQSYIEFHKNNFSLPSIQKVVYYTIIMLAVGIFEEVLNRGVILNNMLNTWGNTKKGVIKAVILSSLIFGLGHFVNLVAAPTLIVATISQVIYSSLHGILFSSIYIRCKNIWAVVFLHSIYDWLVKVSSLYHSAAISNVPRDISIVAGVINVVFALPFAIVGLFLLRKVFVEDRVNTKVGMKSV